MSNLQVNRDSKKLIIISPLDDGEPYEGAYTVAIAPYGVQPTAFVDPQVDGEDSGIFIGPDTGNVFELGQILQAWWLPTGITEVDYTDVLPLVEIT